jgi:hypothetical protein
MHSKSSYSYSCKERRLTRNPALTLLKIPEFVNWIKFNSSHQLSWFVCEEAFVRSDQSADWRFEGAAAFMNKRSNLPWGLNTRLYVTTMPLAPIPKAPDTLDGVVKKLCGLYELLALIYMIDRKTVCQPPLATQHRNRLQIRRFMTITPLTLVPRLPKVLCSVFGVMDTGDRGGLLSPKMVNGRPFSNLSSWWIAHFGGSFGVERKLCMGNNEWPRRGS